MWASDIAWVQGCGIHIGTVVQGFLTTLLIIIIIIIMAYCLLEQGRLLFHDEGISPIIPEHSTLLYKLIPRQIRLILRYPEYSLFTDVHRLIFLFLLCK